MYILLKVCEIGSKEFDLTSVMGVFKLIITVIQYLIPVVLILWGSMDLFKAVTAGKEDDIKAKQKTLIKRAIAAVIVFILPWAVVTIMGFLGPDVKGLADCYRQSDPGFPQVDPEGKDIDN